MAGLGPFARDRRLMVGVSGGPDSMALALLLARWGRPLAGIVDHGLRAGSGAEAALTRDRLAAIGVEARILRAAVPLGPGLSERAREARYALLLAACHEAGCADLALAHHARDQAETVRIRQERGSGALGLAGMAPISCRGAARLLRPLLGVPPARLAVTLEVAGIAWVEDPTNTDPRTPRARLRAEMDAADLAAALALSARHGAARRERERRAAAELAWVSLHPEGFALAPAPLGPDALSALLWTLSGAPHPPSPALLEAGLRPRTAHGVLIRRAGRLGPFWLLAREPEAVAGPEPARPGLRWDGRFLLAGPVPDGLTIGALGADAARLRDRSRLPAVVLQGLPAVRRGAALVAVPHLGFRDPEACPNVNVRFCPARPVAGAPFVPTPVNRSEGPGDA